MRRREFVKFIGASAGIWPLLVRAQQSATPVIGLTDEEAQSIAQEAYIYFYPLVIMDVSRKHFTNIEPDKMFARGPMNTFSHARTFPPATFRGANHANFDTLYSVGWLDLTKEPVVISVPDTQGRYYLLQLLDDGFVRWDWEAHDWYGGWEFRRRWTWLAGRFAPRSPAHQCSNSVCLGHWSNPNRWPSRLRCRPQGPGRLQNDSALALGKGAAGRHGHD